ncbi:hypothetical protein QYF36_021910 [Acer negundo]|nr:hypothetical protein QYF36_021910 [Acer negundo]
MLSVAWVNGAGGVGNVSFMYYILDIKEILFKCKPRLSVKFVSRCSNAAADFLAKQGAASGLVQGGFVLGLLFCVAFSRFSVAAVCLFFGVLYVPLLAASVLLLVASS